ASLSRLATEVDGVSVDKRLVVGSGGSATDLVDRVHAAGLLAFAWTFRPGNQFLALAFRRGKVASEWGDWRAELDVLLGTGIDGIFFDHPDLAPARPESEPERRL